MPTNEESAFLVNPHSDPVVVRVEGKASYLNASPLNTFVRNMIEHGRKRFVFDFQRCTGMDSTFLGIIAGVALAAQDGEEKNVALCRLGNRNLELVRNLGLHHIAQVVTGDAATTLDKVDEAGAVPLDGDSSATASDNARLVLEAHENLCEADESNRSKFQDVIAFLKNQVESR